MLESDGGMTDPHQNLAARPDVGSAPLESVVCTAELSLRPVRNPDYQTESRALLALAQALAESPDTILETLTEKILTLLNCHSAGVSLLSDDEKSFHWSAVAGVWSEHVGGGTPRDFGPCGDVLDGNTPMLFRHPERRYAYLLPTHPPAVECLLVPFHLQGKAVGTIWAIAHDECRTFDAEDLRQLQSLGTFASAAYQAHLSRARELSRTEAASLSSKAMESLNAELSASETAVRRGENDLRDFVENAAIGLHWVGADGTILWANRTELDLLGFEKEEYIGRNIADFHADQPVIDDILARLTGGETLHDYGARLKSKDGSIRHVLISSNALFEDDVFVHTRCFTRDITKHTQADEVLRISEAGRRLALDSAELGTFNVYPSTNTLTADDRFRTIFGCTDARLDYERIFALVHPDDRLRIRDAVAAAIRPVNPVAYSEEYRVVHADASVHWVFANGRATFTGDGPARTLLSFDGTVADITVRKFAEAASRERDAFHRSIIESSPDCIKVLDLDGNLLALYHGKKLLGIEDLEPFLNRPWVEFWDGVHREAAQKALTKALANDEGRFVGFFRTLRDEPKWWDVCVSPIRGADGKPERLLAVSRDVTERRQSEISSEFLASISDDLLHCTGVDEMMRTVGAKVGACLGLSICAFVEINETAKKVVIEHDWHREDVPGLVGVYHLSDFVEEEFIRVARTGNSIVVRDVTADARTDPDKFVALSIASFICVPLIRDDLWVFALCLYKSEAYEWRTDEIELARELAARIWARLERLRTEEALRRSEERYRTMFEQMDEAFCVLELRFDDDQKPIDFLYLDVNPSFERETGLEQVKGKWVSEVVPNLEDHWLQTYAKVALTGQPIRYVNEAAELEGRWFDLYAFRVGGDDSRKVAVLFRNIKQQLIAARALRESEERYRSLFDSMDEAFCIIEMVFDGMQTPVDFHFLEVNPAFARQTGWHDAVGKRVLELAPGIEAYWIEIYGQVSVTGEPMRFMNRLQEMNAWFDVYAFRLGGPDSWKVAVIFSNITDRINTEHALRDAAEAMVDLDHRKDEFLAMLGHELRNPLAPISNAVHLMRLQPDETPLQNKARVIIERQLGQLTHLVDDLLEVSRINTGKIQLREERIVVSGIVERALETVQSLVQQHRHALSVSVPPEPILVFADAARMEQVLVNLLTNSAKYTADGGQIWLTVEQDGDEAVVRVRDTGVGIAPELLPRIFDVFTQAQRSLDRSQGGLGIGLCLVKRLVELHGGRVTVTSVLGEGSEFVVRLPLLHATLLPTLPTAALPVVPPVACCGVLVVDDNVDAARSLAMLMQVMGHDVRMAYDGPTAVEAAIRYRPNLILLDIGLPGLTGFEVAERIRQRSELSDTVLVAMTGYGQEADRSRSRDSGFDHHIVKPADFDEMQRILATVSDSVTMTSVARDWPALDALETRGQMS